MTGRKEEPVGTVVEIPWEPKPAVTLGAPVTVNLPVGIGVGDYGRYGSLAGPHPQNTVSVDANRVGEMAAFFEDVACQLRRLACRWEA